MKLTYSSRETLLGRIDQPPQLADQGPLFPTLGLSLNGVAARPVGAIPLALWTATFAPV